MPGPKILIADDDPDIVRLIAMLLRKAGYELYIAMDGCQAVDFAHRYEPDLYILDVNMPAGSGMTVQERIQKVGHLCTSPIIYLTGDKSDKTLEDIRKMTPYKVLFKPVDVMQLVHSVKSALDQHIGPHDYNTREQHEVGNHSDHRRATYLS